MLAVLALLLGVLSVMLVITTAGVYLVMLATLRRSIRPLPLVVG